MKPSMMLLSGILVATTAVAILSPGTATASDKKQTAVERGKYLVGFAGCDDCHSPKVMTPMGPVPDTTRRLSGHPVNEELTEVPMDYIGPDKWGAITNNGLTAWAGPWGISFTANLTPDLATGLGSWTEDIFIKALRTGKHMGEGRDILPPMPWPQISTLTDEDLKAVFAFLQSLKPIENPVPEPIPPTAIPTFKKQKN